jgi:hypothetical protein
MQTNSNLNNHNGVSAFKRGRGRPVTATPEKKKEDARLRAARFYEKKRIKEKCVKFANEQLVKIAVNSFAAASEVHWTKFILYLNGFPCNYVVTVDIDGATRDTRIETDFEGLVGLILNDNNIYQLG